MATIKKEKALDVIRQMVADGQVSQEVAEKYFPELKESEGERMVKFIKKQLFNIKKTITENYELDAKLTKAIDWLEKQGEKILANSCKTCKDGQKSADKEYTFKAIPRLLEMIQPTDRVKSYCQKLIDNLEQEGYCTDAKIVRDCLKQMNGEKVAIATMDEQKPDDKVEPKFHKGDFVVNRFGDIWHIDSFDSKNYQVSNDLSNDCYFSIERQNVMHLWSIQDAKDGDVLVDEDNNIGIYKEIEGLYWNSYIYLGCDGKLRGFSIGGSHKQANTRPATKEQRDLLFKKMKEAGYEWDAEKKELKYIDNEEDNGEDYGIDSLWHAQRILEKTLGKVDGYQSDDGILEHKCAISAVKKLYEQNPAWSEEDEDILFRTINDLKFLRYTISIDPKYAVNIIDTEREINWLKSLKDRIQPQLKQEWSEEDENNILFLTSIIEECFKDKEKITLYGDTVCANFTKEDVIDRLKSLRPQSRWKPSDEQIKALSAINVTGRISYVGQRQELINLYNDLKKLKEE